MQLLTDVVFETDNTFKLMQLFYKSIINSNKDNFSFKNFIKYDEFKIIIHKFIIETMGIFIAYTEYSDDTYDVYIKKLPMNLCGLFRSNKNELFINENVIKDIYDGKLEEFMTILHELNHFKVKYEILFGVINLDICRCVKELLLRDEDSYPFRRNFKNDYLDDFYYSRNYKNYSEEVYVDMCSKKDFSLFMKIILITFYLNSEKNMKKIDNFVDKYIKDSKIGISKKSESQTKVLTADEELERLIGLSNVKTNIKKIRAYAKKNKNYDWYYCNGWCCCSIW